MAYVYRHIRLDKNVPFYIGISERKRRANDAGKSGRNPLWRFIASKTNYDIEVIIDDIDFEFAKQKEIEFIKLYGRIDLGTGTLANLTNGGEGRMKHNYCKYDLYNIYTNIKKVCYSKIHKYYHLYGGVGVTICDEWLNDFMVFNEWALKNGWEKGKLIKRKNKLLKFDEFNCYIADNKSKLNAKRERIINYRGNEMTLNEAVEKYKIPYRLLLDRLQDNWEVSRAIETPVMGHKRNNLPQSKNIYNGYVYK